MMMPVDLIELQRAGEFFESSRRINRSVRISYRIISREEDGATGVGSRTVLIDNPDSRLENFQLAFEICPRIVKDEMDLFHFCGNMKQLFFRRQQSQFLIGYFHAHFMREDTQQRGIVFLTGVIDKS